MTLKRFLALAFPAVLPFVAVYFSIMDRPERFFDENVAVIDGMLMIQALEYGTDATKAIAATYNAQTSIGIPVALPAGTLFKIFGSIYPSRIFMGVWTTAFWLSILSLVFSIFIKADPQLTRSRGMLTFYGFLTLCFVQAVPLSYINQAQALSEFPGLTFVFFGLSSFLWQRGILGAFFFGMAVVLKLNFILYAPAALLISLFLSPHRLPRSILLVTTAFLAPQLAAQLIKCFVFGPKYYFLSWQPYLKWFLEESGTGSKATFIVNEWPGYSWRTKGYYLLGSVLPILAAAASWRFKQIPRSWTWILLAVSFTVGASSIQWFFMAAAKFWRRTFFFVVPGYAIGVISAILAAHFLTRNRAIVQKAVLAFLLLVALYVQGRQTVYPLFENLKPLTEEQMRYLYWAVGAPNF